VFGSEAYKRVCVELAAEHGFRITNPELHGDIARARQPTRTGSIAHEVELEPRAPTRPPVGDISAAYRAHLEDIRSTPESRRVDASRVDGLIATRLRATGYPRDRVTEVIKTEASKSRPREQRNWDGYARRVVDHAFGRSGERDLRELLPGVRELGEIEGRSTSRSRRMRRDLDRGR
jgi:hypothetical protein